MDRRRKGKNAPPAGSRRPEGEVRLLQAVAVAANEAASVEEALQTCLDAVCAHTGWPLGHAWLLEADGMLAPTGIWHLAEPGRFPGFREATARTRLAPGRGVSGRVLASGEPEWIEDITARTDLVRVVAREEGIRAGIAFPVRVGRQVAGVLEFFSDRPLPRDPALLGVMVNLGTQVGRAVERARAEEALRLSEAKFAGIMSISSDAIVSVDEGQRIVFFNHGAEHTFGYAAGEVVGEPLERLIPEAHRAGHAEHVHAFGAGPVAARRMGERGQISGRRKGGEAFPADASISRLEVGGTQIYTAVIRDVTDRVRAEDALARQTDAIARQGEELARSNADLEQFAYVASHDLQEPLRMVSSYAQLLSRRYRERLDDDAREFIGYMVDGVARMQSLIAGLLTFSRLGSGGDAYQPVALGEALARALSNLEAAIGESGAVVTADPLPTVDGDPAQLAQLFQNLVGNGVKFRGEAAPRVHVSAERVNGEWRLHVRDNGIGIEPEYAERIFVIFQRLHGRAEYPGTGIGLALCRKIVERHGGRIWVESRSGEGSSFCFTLPADEAR